MALKRICFTLAILLIHLTSRPQSSKPVTKNYFGIRPEMKEDNGSPGHYEMVSQLDKFEINPGDTINLNIYISGYGEIHGSKIYCEAPRSYFYFDLSYILKCEFNSTNKESVRIKPLKFNIPTPFTFTLHGAKDATWQRATTYIDLIASDTTSLAIIPELGKPIAPIFYHLKTRDDIEPGTHNFILVYTYFNGQEWQGQQQQITLKVKNQIERNLILYTILGILLAFIAIIPLLYEGSLKLYKIQKDVISKFKIRCSPKKKKAITKVSISKKAMRK